MKTAAAYIRVSTDDQIEFSPDSQLKALKGYAEKNDMLLPDDLIFMDEGISGKTTAKRPSFNRMISMAKSKPKPFDVILVWKYSRFARNREDSIVYKSMLRKELNIDVISITENVGDDKMSILFEAMIEAMDEYYSINLAEEVIRGMTEKAKRGGVLGGPPFGYKIENDIFVPVEEEAQVIRKVFQDYNNGKGFLRIAKELNAIGIRTRRGNLIENRTVEYWLNNPTYIGKTRWNPTGKSRRNYNNPNEIIVDGVHEPIVPIELWEQVQEKMKAQKEHYRKYFTSERNKLSSWMTGLLRCEKCGATLSYAGGFFICSKKTKGICEGNGCISAKVISRIIINTLEDIFNGSVEVEVSPKQSVRVETENSEKQILLNQLSQVESRLERIKTAFENGIDTIEEYRASKAKITAEKESLYQKLSSISSEESEPAKSVDKDNVRRLVEILKDDTVPDPEKNKLARMVIKEVIKGGEDGRNIKVVLWE